MADGRSVVKIEPKPNPHQPVVLYTVLSDILLMFLSRHGSFVVNGEEADAAIICTLPSYAGDKVPPIHAKRPIAVR